MPLTAGSWVAIWDICPELHPVSATVAASPQAASDMTDQVRLLLRFTEASCSADAYGDDRTVTVGSP
ncbi:2-hydroxy-3-oxopropionate reductase [Mycolicibacterium thermoresistibile]|uniref:2-hydroxy-3-oxopropionate reductase n=1 Tax=Mycolicibacterium thermoresistibile TaxID=1797 RepID=A0A100XH46_MYCTH|nr:2-hydroxy-3-oxopropionate reductase [Mycolicibacterium thermoresistibile]